MSNTQDTPAPDVTLPLGDHPVLRSLETYWRSLRHANRLPARNDLAPHQIDGLLPYALILHRVAPGVARIRVAGQRINDLLRMDARGMPFSILFTPTSRDRIADLIESGFASPAIITADLAAPAQMLRAAMTARMMLLPLADDQGRVSRMLGAIVTDGVIGQRPRRFDLLTERALRIDPLPVAQKPGTARPALRLVVNNG